MKQSIFELRQDVRENIRDSFAPLKHQLQQVWEYFQGNAGSNKPLNGIELPKFSGNNVMKWIYTCERIFIKNPIHDAHKLCLVVNALEDSAAIWYKAMGCLKSTKPCLASWNAFLEAIYTRFGQGNMKPFYELVEKKQQLTPGGYVEYLDLQLFSKEEKYRDALTQETLLISDVICDDNVKKSQFAYEEEYLHAPNTQPENNFQAINQVMGNAVSDGSIHPLLKTGLPKFYGENVLKWMYQCELVFIMEQIPENHKLWLVEAALEARTDIGHQSLGFLKSTLPSLISWDAYVEAVYIRLSSGNMKLLYELQEKKQLHLEEYKNYLELKLWNQAKESILQSIDTSYKVLDKIPAVWEKLWEFHKASEHQKPKCTLAKEKFSKAVYDRVSSFILHVQIRGKIGYISSLCSLLPSYTILARDLQYIANHCSTSFHHLPRLFMVIFFLILISWSFIIG